MIVRPATIDEVLTHGAELFSAHWQETEAHFKSPPAPLVEVYRELEAKGMCIAFIAETPSGVCAGYATAFVHPHMHYGWRCASHDTLFVHRDFRASSAGRRLVEALKREARARGAERFFWHAKKDSKLDALLTKLGEAQLEELVYREEL